MYYENGRWGNYRSLPPRYRNFDMYRAHKVVINEPTPWNHHDRYKKQYYSYRGRNDQQAIRNSREERYWENARHPQHSKWHGNNGRGNGHDNRQDNRQDHRQDQRQDNRQDRRQENNRDNKHDNGKGHGNGNGGGHGNGHGKKD